MSNFTVVSTILEQQLENYLIFLDENLGLHELQEGNIELFKDMIAKVKQVDYNTIFIAMLKTLLIPNWTVIFEADNHLDSGKKSLEQQTKILDNIISTLKTEGKVNSKYLPEKVAEIINRDFLTDLYKVNVLIAELSAEFNLCNPEISWKQAHAERIRVAYYSALLCGNSDIIMPIFNKFENIVKYGKFKYLNNFVDSNYFKGLRIQKSELGIELLDTKLSTIFFTAEMKQLGEEFLQKLGSLDIFPLIKPDIIQLFEGLADISIVAAIADDFLDLAEDIENNKITGMTQGLKSSVDPKHVFSTTLLYIRLKLYDTGLTDYIKDWADQLLKTIFNDMPGFAKFCKDEMPFLFDHIFQRI